MADLCRDLSTCRRSSQVGDWRHLTLKSWLLKARQGTSRPVLVLFISLEPHVCKKDQTRKSMPLGAMTGASEPRSSPRCVQHPSHSRNQYSATCQPTADMPDQPSISQCCFLLHLSAMSTVQLTSWVNSQQFSCPSRLAEGHRVCAAGTCVHMSS